MPQFTREATAEQQPGDRHARLEHPEDQAHLPPGPRIDPGHPDPTEAAKFDSPSDTATSSRATMI